MINALSKILGRKRSGSRDPPPASVTSAPKTKESIWQKATSLRQSLRHPSRSKTCHKAVGIPDHSSSLPPGSHKSSSKLSNLRREWGSHKNLARERKSLAVAPKSSSANGRPEVSKRSLHARSLCVVSGDEWDFDMMVKSTPEGIDKAESGHALAGYQVDLPRHLRSSRKLTKDSGYETSAQGDPDYINTLSDWLSEENALDKVGQSSATLPENGAGDIAKTMAPVEKRLEWNSRQRPLSFSHQEVPIERKNRQLRHSYSQREVATSGHCYENHRFRQPNAESLHCVTILKPESRYSSVESVANASKGHLARSTPHLANLKNVKKGSPPSLSFSNLRSNSVEEENSMVTRRFKKGSVYDALASTSGLDFSPVVQSKAYSSRREDSSNNSGASKVPNRLWEDPSIRRAADGQENQKEKTVSNKTPEATQSSFPPELDGKKNSPRESKRFQQPLPQVPTNTSPGQYSCVTSHEKYPSWPVTNVCSPAASFRSHSWIPQTDYPKEKIGYMRPKKSFKISTNQLQPVLEKSPDSNAKKPAEQPSPSPKEVPPPVDQNHSLNATYTSPNNCNNNSSSKTFDFEAFHTPCIPQCYGDKDYNIHSPPERDTSLASSGANSDAVSDSNSFLSKYEDVIRHQAQYSVPLSMWNKHDGSEKDNSSVDTPFLDRLRLDSARAWPQPPPPPPPPSALLVAPPQNDIELSSENGTWMGSMESSSHGRGLPKWQGSYSDLSTLSTQLSNRSSLFDSGHSTMPESGRLSPQSSCGSTAPSLLLEGPTRAQVVARHGCHREIVAHSARVQQPERHGSESVLYYATGAPQRPKTAMAFNGDDPDRMKSPEPVPGPSGIRHSLSEENAGHHRSQALLHLATNPLSSSCRTPDVASADRHSSKKGSRSSNSFSSEDSCFRTKEPNDDTSGSSSDVSNITCISNYRESFASSQSWDTVSSVQNIHPSSVCPRSNKQQSKSTSSSEELSKFQPPSYSPKQNSSPESSVQGNANAVSNYGRIQPTSSRSNSDYQTCRDKSNEQHTKQRSPGEGKSRSLDEESRKVLCNDVEKRQRVSEPDLKTIQKQAVFSFYQRMSLAESIRGSSSNDSAKSPIEKDPGSSNELPSPTRLKWFTPKLSILPNKYTLQEFDNKKHSRSDSSSQSYATHQATESSGRTDSQSTMLHSKSVPNLLSLKNQNVDSRPSNPQQPYWAGSVLQPAKRGSPLAKEEIIPWDQLPSVLEKKREAAGRVQPGRDSKSASLASENKEPPEDGSSNTSSSSATNYFKGHKSPRKVQLKEVHHTNETASVKVITQDGVTLVQTTSDKTNALLYPKDVEKKSREDKNRAHHAHQHHKRRPAPPPPPKQPPKRPPPPPPPESPPPPSSPIVVIMEESGTADVDKELRVDEHRLDVGGRRPDGGMPCSSSSPELLRSYSGEVECCSSPDLPLPPPPSRDGLADVVSNEPLPPPPDVLEVELSNRTLDSSIVYPKNSYMSYRSEKKLGRQGFEGNYRRSFHTSSSSMDLSTLGSSFPDGVKDPLSPSTWELMHNIRQHGTTVIFHSDALRPVVHRSSSQELLSAGHNGEAGQNDDQLATPDPVPSPPTSQNGESHSGDGATDSTQPETSVGSQANDSIVIQCDTSIEDISSLENCLLTDDSFVDSMESDSSSLISVDHNQNAVDNGPCDQTIPAPVSNYNNNHNDLVIRTNSSTQTSDTPRLGRKCTKTKEELECERLSVNFLHHCDDLRLKNLLVPAENHRSMSDYMDGLLNLQLEKGGLPLQRCLSAEQCTRNGHWNENSKSPDLSNNSPECKVRQFNHMDIIENQNVDGEQELKKIRDDLMVSIKKKVENMRREQVIIREETQRNEKRGKDLANRVQKLARPNEAEKYILHVEEMEKIINLLLSLSGRLAKAENMIRAIPKDASPEEKRILEAKRNKLLEQHEDARRLKESIDRRSNQISAFLHRYLSDQEYDDYDFFIKMKARLIVDSRETDEKINLGEEQLLALRNSLDSQLWKSANS